jgi:hypothetical protein
MSGRERVWWVGEIWATGAMERGSLTQTKGTLRALVRWFDWLGFGSGARSVGCAIVKLSLVMGSSFGGIDLRDGRERRNNTWMYPGGRLSIGGVSLTGIEAASGVVGQITLTLRGLALVYYDISRNRWGTISVYSSVIDIYIYIYIYIYICM